MNKELTEESARRSETGLMAGRLYQLTMDRTLSTDQRIGACKALQVLESRLVELEGRRKALLPKKESV